MANEEQDPHCPLCQRPIPPEQRSLHHLVPKSLKGRETVVLHRICHRKIHSLFTERELAKHYPSIDALKAHQDVQAFVRWVAKRDPGFYARTAASRRKSRRG